jgi:cytochrome d ubiquinol oxidase subunit II
MAWMAGLVTAVVAVAFLGWTQVQGGDPASLVVSAVAAVALVGAIIANRLGREGWSFIGTALTIVLAVVALFVALFPDVMPSSTNAAYSLTTTNAASTPYTLSIMTVIAVVFTPLVLVYQGWTYWVFRRRVSVDLPPADEAPGQPGATLPMNPAPPPG